MTPPSAAGAGTTADYRQIAHQILGEDRFRPPPLPRPLHGVLDALGGVLEPIGEAIADAFSAVSSTLPGGGATVWTVLGATVVALAAVASRRMTDRTLADRAAPRTRLGAAPGAPDAQSLEAAAEAAERDGRFEQAVRLRFQAGLLRLDEIGVVAYRPSLPNGAVSRRLRSPIFDALARRFEEVAYGGRPAEAGDPGQARDGWRRVLGEAGRK
ncbi:MAG: DUF4129 domain-containing protein [Solirubrobacteraceae bacterium]